MSGIIMLKPSRGVWVPKTSSCPPEAGIDFLMTKTERSVFILPESEIGLLSSLLHLASKRIRIRDRIQFKLSFSF